jgi:hypothetical protein
LPLNVFIEVETEKNYKLLGKAPLSYLIENFTELISQYNKTLGGDNQTIDYLLLQQFLLLESKISRGQSCCLLLALNPTEANFNKLFKFGYLLPAYNFEPKNIQFLIDSFEGYIKRDTLELEVKKRIIEKNKAAGNVGKSTRQDFLRIIAELSKTYGHININTIMTETFCSYQKAYNDELEAKRKKN